MTASSACKDASAAASLRKEACAFNIRMHQLTLPYLFKGYYPQHSLVVATLCLLISLALVCSGCSNDDGSDPSADSRIQPSSSSPPLFRSFTSFAASAIVATMVMTACYRVLVGNDRNASTHACYASQQANWIVDVLIKEGVQAVVSALSKEPPTSRVVMIAAVSVVAELGRVLGSTPAVMVAASLAWLGYLAYTARRNSGVSSAAAVTVRS